MAKIDLSSLVLAALTVLCLYQHYLIYNLEVKVEAMHFNSQQSHSSTTEKDVTVGKQVATLRAEAPVVTESAFSHKKKSPPPQVPAYVKPSENEQRTQNVRKSQIYGGAGDEIHLGGFTQRDNNTISYNVWNYMLGPLAVKSFMDIGCGKGFSASYFKENGAKVLCVEGSHDAIKNSLLDRKDIVQHDFSKGPWWPEDTYDVAYSTEFLEHVGRQYSQNYMATFKQAALIMVTSSGWGGYHHVEVHHVDWWVMRFEAQGLVYSEEMSKAVRSMVGDYGRDGGQILGSIMVFINPAVASLPKHAHLVGGNGCFGNAIDNHDNGEPCSGADSLPPAFQSLLQCKRIQTPHEPNVEKIKWTCQKNPNAVIAN